MRHVEWSADPAPIGRSDGSNHPPITARWVRLAVQEARVAFEREMERERRVLDREFDRFWRARRTQHA